MTTLVPERLVALSSRLNREIDSGLLPSCQWAVAIDGEVVAGDTLGDATPESRYVIFSATKPITASVVWMLLAERKLSLDAKVGEYIPEFATHGKDVVTVEQVLLHTSGFPRQLWGEEMITSAGRRATFAEWGLNWEPGAVYEYHLSNAHWVLAELIETVTGTNYRDVVRSRLAPLGLADLRLGRDALDDVSNIEALVNVGEMPSGDELEALLGIRELPETELTLDSILSLNSPEARALAMPAAGAIMQASTLALFYQALLHNPGELWDPVTLVDATGHVRNQLPDPLFQTPANRTIGLVIAGDDGRAALRGFGRTVSARTFGHGGAGGQIAWADPQTGVSFAYLTNGYDHNFLREPRRGVALSSLAGELTKAL